MQGWMIALTVVACVILIIAVAFFAGSFIAFEKVLGRRNKPGKGDPEDYGIDIKWFDDLKDSTEVVEIKAYDGVDLRALLIKQSGERAAARVAVCQHGYSATPRSMQAQAKIFYDRGFDVLLPAARGHSISGGKYVGMAWIDRFDILRWTDKVVSVYGSSVEIALVGVSMGGASVVAAAGMNPPSQVKCLIDDCGFSSQREEYLACLKKVRLPKSLALLPLAVGVRLKLGYSIADADIVPLARNVSVPSLFIHGESDKFVPYELGVKLYEACGAADKALYSVPGAAHACAYVKDPQKYTDTVGEFIDRVF